VSGEQIDEDANSSIVFVAVSGVGAGQPEKTSGLFLTLFFKKGQWAFRIPLQQVHLAQA
jgi:hypothetical protein